jgi:hypothetical protein
VYYDKKEKLEEEIYKLNNALKNNKQNFKDQFFTFKKCAHTKVSVKMNTIIFIQLYNDNEMYKIFMQLENFKLSVFYNLKEDFDHDVNRLYKLGFIKKEK